MISYKITIGLMISFHLIFCIFSKAVNDDDLADFDFENSPKNPLLFEYYDEPIIGSEKIDKIYDFESFEDENVQDSYQNFFQLKEKMLRTALAKSLTNKYLRQQFVEVIPILRVLSKPQKLALASLISAQVSAKPEAELKYDQVRSLFGDSKKLIIPLMFDIANLVRNSAKTSQLYRNYSPLPETKITRRNFEITAPSSIEEENYSADGVLDAKLINEQLYADDELHEKTTLNHKRMKRSDSPPFFDKLVQIIPLVSQQQQENQERHQIDNRAYHERKLNVSDYMDTRDQLALPSENQQIMAKLNSTGIPQLSYEQIENLAFADLNTTDVYENESNNTDEVLPEELPVPESLIGQRFRVIKNKLGTGNRKLPMYQKRTQLRQRRPPMTPHKNCERFTSSMCIRTEDYPMDQIMGSIRRHRHAMTALLAEYHDNRAQSEYDDYLEDLEFNKKRREDEVTSPSGMCSSVVKYARPQKARSASGEWKYIVNTGEHTQTLRLEKCSNPEETCSYLSENYRSRCMQVFNYHRLLSWDKTRGLHVDIFKVPTCCSCHVDGYREIFPPVSPSLTTNKIKDYSPILRNHYTTIPDDDEEYEEDDEDGEESIAYQFSNGFKRVKPLKYDTSSLVLSSSNLKSSKVNSPTIGSYLSPPTNDFDTQYTFKRGPNLTPNSGNHLIITRARRPINSYTTTDGDDRSDQDISGSEYGKEVTLYPTIDRSTVRPKRKRISSVSTATSTQSASSNSISAIPTSSSPTTTQTRQHNTDKKTLLNTKLTNTKSSDVNKRINYNYHPIIDFFEEENFSSTAPLSKKSVHDGGAKIKDRRVGIGAINDGDDTWRPIVQ